MAANGRLSEHESKMEVYEESLEKQKQILEKAHEELNLTYLTYSSGGPQLFGGDGGRRHSQLIVPISQSLVSKFDHMNFVFSSVFHILG